MEARSSSTALRLGLLAVLVFGLAPNMCSAERIQLLLTGQIEQNINPLQGWLRGEPLIDYLAVPSRDLRNQLGGDEAMERFIRIYFPRTYDDTRRFDFFLLNSPVTGLFEEKQLRWMYDSITEGSGGLNTASIMSQYVEVYGPWVNSVLQRAFPNDAPAVARKMKGATSAISSFRIEVNEQFPEPVLTPFIKVGVERYVGVDSRFIILRDGASAIAWQVGNFPGYQDVPFIAAWDYEEGRALTTGDAFGHTFWSSYRGKESDNLYAPDMLINMILYGVGLDPFEDIELPHRLRSSFRQYRERMGILISLKDFVERFGASSTRIDERISELSEQLEEASELYLEMDMEGCEEVMDDLWVAMGETEALAVELKNSALMWVYLVEWLVTTSALMISGFVVWSLMVRRRLYREAGTTKARG